MGFDGKGQWTWKQFFLCALVCLGEVAFAYPASIIGTTLAQPSFLTYMHLLDSEGNFTAKSNALTGAMSGVFQAGGCFGILMVIYIMDKWGRRAAVVCVSAIGLVSGALLCASQSVAMFLVFRFFAGIGSWGTVTITPVYSAELAPPAMRGFFGGVNGIAIGIGYSFATYMGLAFYSESETGPGQWRGPYGIGLIFNFIPLISTLIIPESPRWLLMAGRVDDAKSVVRRLHDLSHVEEHHFAIAEFYQMQKQVEYDKTLNPSWLEMVKRPSYRKRVALAAGFAFLSQSTSILVINNYGSILYRSLGYDTRKQLIFQCGWITTGLSGNIVGSFILDKIGRRPLILLGISGCIISLSAESALVATYASPVPEINPNEAAIRAAIAMLYVFTFLYGIGIDVTLWVFCGELFPNHLRAKGMAICTLGVCLTSLIYLEVASTAFANIGWKFYLVFISICAVGFVWLWLTLPETSRMPLEEIAALFGDQDEVMVFSQDIQTSELTNEFEIKEQARHIPSDNTGEKNGESRHHEIIV